MDEQRSPQPAGTGRRRAIATRVLAAIAVVASTLGLVSTYASADVAPLVHLRAPSSARIGQPITVVVAVRGAEQVSAFQTTILFDTAAAELTGVRHHSALTGATRPLPTVATADGAVVGAWSCDPAHCQPGVVTPPGEAGDLLTIELLPLRAGSLTIATGPTRVVEHDGSTVEVPSSSASVVQVGDVRGGAAARPRSSVSLAPRRAPRAVTSYDRSGDRRITTADVSDVVASWQVATEQRVPCGRSPDASADLNGDGCVDVVDIQAVGDRTTTPAVQPAALSTQSASAASAPVFTVTSTGDGADVRRDGVCATTAGACTLRAAIQEANAQTVATEIAFAVPGAGPHTIQLGSRLNLLNPAGITIDGYTQPGSAPNTDPWASNAQIEIAIVGNGYSSTSIDGLLMSTPDNVIRGLSIYNVRRAIWITGIDATNNQILGTFACTDPLGQFAATSVVAGSNAVVIQNQAHDNRIGDAGAADRNVFSGCPHHGVVLNDGGTTRNVIQNSIIGLNPAATDALPNQSHGVDINSAITDTVVGGTAPGEGNVISANLQEGVEISHGTQTFRNHVYGNRIGTDATGTQVHPWTGNGREGVRLEGAPTCDQCGDVGGRSTVANNVIAGNFGGGVQADKGRSDNVIRDNKIGVTADGSPGGNLHFGVRLEHGSQRNVVGPGNEIAYNDAGIQLQSVGSEPANPVSTPTHRNRITANSIHDNAGMGIDLAPLFQRNQPGAGDPNTNQGIDLPIITGTTANGVSGTTCAACAVEVFSTDGTEASGYGEADSLLGSGVADSTGRFSIVMPSEIRGLTVTATATDAAGNTSEVARNVTVPATASGAHASDSFTRVQSNGWGAADAGGSWEAAAFALSRLSVDGTRGRITLNPGDSIRAYLPSVSVRDVSFDVLVELSQLPGATMNVAPAVRQVDAGTEYRARIQVYADGRVGVVPARRVDNALVLLTREVIVPGLDSTDGLRVRVSATGAFPTTVRVKVWQDGAPEPADWTVAATDAEPRLQVAGAVGLTAFLPASSPGRIALFDDVLVGDA